MLCYVYSHYQDQRTCDVIPPDAPSQKYYHLAHGTCIYRSDSGYSIYNPDTPNNDKKSLKVHNIYRQLMKKQ